MKRILIIAVAGTVSAASAQTMYTVRVNDGVLQSIDISDPNNPVFSDVGPLNTPFAFGGLTYDARDHLMYMVAGRNNNSLYTVDLGSGNATGVGGHGITDLFSIAWDSTTDTLYAAPFIGNGRFVTLDQGDGSATDVGTISARIGGLMYDAARDRLVGSSDGAGDLYEIDRTNGDQTLLFKGPFTDNSGLVHDTVNDLYWGIDYIGNMYYYDPNDGLARTDVLSGIGSHDGLAYVPADGCPADLDGDGDTDADDFFAYLDGFAAGNLDVCDIDGDDDCDADDFFGYLDLFAQGC